MKHLNGEVAAGAVNRSNKLFSKDLLLSLDVLNLQFCKIKMKTVNCNRKNKQNCEKNIF